MSGAKRVRPSIAVVGSISMDLVVELPRLPSPGETFVGRNATFYAGGKGANQAIAAGALATTVRGA